MVMKSRGMGKWVHEQIRIAVVDLGTNTFNLLVAANALDGKLHFLQRERRPVFLGRNGIDKNLIAYDAMLRAWEVLQEYKRIAQEQGVAKIFALGTSALRTAQNASEFIIRAQAILGTDIQVITGSEEAELIYLGVRQSIESTDIPFLIVDIGGGSNELIIANSKTIFWKKSYPLGMARLKALFSFSEPITPAEIERLNDHLAIALSDFLNEILPQYKVQTLIGAEGAFESFLHMARHTSCNLQTELSTNTPYCHDLSYDCFFKIKEKLVASTLEERFKMEGLESFRAEMIVPAVLFVNFLLERLSLPLLRVSEYSLKEGAVWKYFFGSDA
ncbi:MAG: hypothetical protein ACP5PZ_06860 [Bacteroidales bacterium]